MWTSENLPSTHLYDDTTPWRSAWISSTSYLNRFNYLNDRFIWRPRASGYYRVKNYFYWGSKGTYHVQYSPYCYNSNILP